MNNRTVGDDGRQGHIGGSIHNPHCIIDDNDNNDEAQAKKPSAFTTMDCGGR